MVDDVERHEVFPPAGADAHTERRAPSRRVELDEVIRTHARPDVPQRV